MLTFSFHLNKPIIMEKFALLARVEARPGREKEKSLLIF